MHKRIDCFCPICNRRSIGNVLSEDSKGYYVACHTCSTIGEIYKGADVHEWEDVDPITLHHPKKTKKPENTCKIPIQEDVARAIDLD